IVQPSPYRSLIAPVMQYLDVVQAERQDDFVTVVIPEAVPGRWWQHFLHGQSGFLLKLALLTRPDVVVANVRYPLQPTTRPLPPTGASPHDPDHPHDHDAGHNHDHDAGH